MDLEYYLKSIPRYFTRVINLDFFERIYGSACYYKYDKKFKFKKFLFNKRELLWRDIFKKNFLENKKILFIEFGVFNGYSFNFFLNNNKNKNSKFIGLDTFEGLPENWINTPRGSFSTNNKIPNFNDNRYKMIKGLFQNSYNKLNDEIADYKSFDEIVIHFDADLYSATLFSLSNLFMNVDNYIAIFDEFFGHESRALHDFEISFPISIDFIGASKKENDSKFRVSQCAFRINHNKVF